MFVAGNICCKIISPDQNLISPEEEDCGFCHEYFIEVQFSSVLEINLQNPLETKKRQVQR